MPAPLYYNSLQTFTVVIPDGETQPVEPLMVGATSQGATQILAVEAIGEFSANTMTFVVNDNLAPHSICDGVDTGFTTVTFFGGSQFVALTPLWNVAVTQISPVLGTPASGDQTLLFYCQPLIQSVA